MMLIRNCKHENIDSSDLRPAKHITIPRQRLVRTILVPSNTKHLKPQHVCHHPRLSHQNVKNIFMLKSPRLPLLTTAQKRNTLHGMSTLPLSVICKCNKRHVRCGPDVLGRSEAPKSCYPMDLIFKPGYLPSRMFRTDISRQCPGIDTVVWHGELGGPECAFLRHRHPVCPGSCPMKCLINDRCIPGEYRRQRLHFPKRLMGPKHASPRRRACIVLPMSFLTRPSESRPLHPLQRRDEATTGAAKDPL